jgi:hypothetical protein
MGRIRVGLSSCAVADPPTNSRHGHSGGQTRGEERQISYSGDYEYKFFHTLLALLALCALLTVPARPGPVPVVLALAATRLKEIIIIYAIRQKMCRQLKNI